ncbi:tetratricopeptide repeat-containing diguanylate cyclase [Megalodesulfovibrio gigas]|uniref:Putative diguanylate cyclase and serine/threonine protein kinase with TPR repeats n=1 Tax=Megalodesulfovibrio gigas (strain ATCC 19364 / DSM 1382 / NCIMB 9332 / VKM B-1759) TaxID=1121448 RepID=T2GG63_MEGG1|nr:tetratricopeptide repeat protein [Megalodesulfovibrio gigas]AGW14972.1 putative diguanylate cyclase and serine/threonine protein kinase with TPR repeats [Megalodesulfovibrio gigas DSM 1382 = ATCC 19364]
MHSRTIPTASTVTLLRQDLVAYEPLLKESLGRFIAFKAGHLFFPQSLPAETRGEDGAYRAAHLARERKVLVPLLFEGKLLGMMVLKGVSLKAPKTTLASLPQLATSCLEQLFLHKLATSDPLTGLPHRQAFLAEVAREIDAVRLASRPHYTHSAAAGGLQLPPDAAVVEDGADPAALPACSEIDPMPAGIPWRAAMGLVAVQLGGLEHIVQRAGHCFAEDALRKAARALAQALPETALPARVGDALFAVFVREATPRLCRETALAVRQALDDLVLTHEVTGCNFRVAASCGHACFPQDIDGSQAERNPAELARVLLDRARKAAAAARDASPERVFAFRQVLEEGGRVSRLLPMHRCIITLGASLGAQEGQRFLVWGKDKPRTAAGGNGLSPLFKGELLIMETSREQSQAEVMHLSDPSWTVEVGDRLTLVRDARNETVPGAATPGGPARDLLTGLLLYRDFLEHLRNAREAQDVFSLALVRVRPKASDGDEAGERFHEHAERLVAEAASLARELLGPEAVGGRFSLNSCIFFHPGQSAEAVLAAHKALAERLDRRGVEAAVGVAGYPFLHYRKADMLDNCRKALEYALLLPAPHLGLCDSLALTIHGDKLFSQNDLFNALEEYKLALLADENNNLARVSLGVCEARLARLPQAREHFEEAVTRDPSDPKALYNLGCVCQRQGEAAAARKAFRRCIALDPGHLYAYIRLGQLSEADGALPQALSWFNKAAALHGGYALTRRPLARLYHTMGRLEEARECLHQALSYDPKDAHSLHLLARMYLDAGEDPELAKVLASQSVALMPGHAPFIKELARALDALGRPQDARDCLAKAQGM